MTDAARCAAENTARFAGGSYPRGRWREAAEAPPRADDRPAEEIAADIWARAGL